MMIVGSHGLTIQQNHHVLRATREGGNHRVEFSSAGFTIVHSTKNLVNQNKA